MLGNVTLMISDMGTCPIDGVQERLSVNLKYPTFEYIDQNPQLFIDVLHSEEYVYLASIAENLPSLNFVTCGFRGKNSLAFTELVNTYEPVVWLSCYFAFF